MIPHYTLICHTVNNNTPKCQIVHAKLGDQNLRTQ